MKLDTKTLKSLFANPNIVAIWTRNGNPVVGLKEMRPIKIKVQGVDAQIVEVGEINALKSRKKKWRPAPGGISIGHEEVTAGTLGTVVQKEDKKILSNNHILANSNNAKFGDNIYQPGVKDIKEPFGWPLIGDFLNLFFRLWYWIFGIEKFKIAYLEWFVTIDFSGGINRADCALAKPFSSLIRDDILDVGVVKAFGNVGVGDMVCKSGRTTEFTRGYIQADDAVVKVYYGNNQIAIYENQLMTTHMVDGGDSGSLLLNDKLEAVGLVFAGSSNYSFSNKIQDVNEALGGFKWIG